MPGGLVGSGSRGGLVGIDDIGAGQVGTADLADNAVTTAKIAANAVGNTDLRDSGACSVIGRAANSAGDPADISAASNNQFLGRQTDAVAFYSLTISNITDAVVNRIPYSDGSVLTSSDQLRYFAATGTFQVEKSLDGSTVTSTIRNTSNTASSAARLLAEVAGASGGNPSLRLSVSGVQTWDVLVNNASSDRLEVVAGSTTVATVLTSGELGLGVAPSAGQHLVVAAATAQLVLNATSNDATLDLQKAGVGTLRLATGATDQTLSARVANHNLVLAANGTGALRYLSGLATERFRVLSDGDFVIGDGNTAATVLATNATAGFLRITTSAGPPTGAAVPGAVHIDETNDHFYFRCAAGWKQLIPDA